MKNEEDDKKQITEVFSYIKISLLSTIRMVEEETSIAKKYIIQLEEIKKMYERILEDDVSIQGKEIIKKLIVNLDKTIKDIYQVKEKVICMHKQYIDVEKTEYKLEPEVASELAKFTKGVDYKYTYYHHVHHFMNFTPQKAEDNSLSMLETLNFLNEKNELPSKIKENLSQIEEYVKNPPIIKKIFQNEIEELNSDMFIISETVSYKIQDFYNSNKENIVSTEYIDSEDICSFFENENFIEMFEIPQIEYDLSNL